ncbi:MAG: isoleucine--tRNA ligase, partial [Clostridia bacterium]|nr:isoleucine--tRNA ligase [Clostridia bacterium]
PKYGKQLGGIQKTLASLDGNAAMDELNVNGKISFMVGDVTVELTKDDLLIDMAQKAGYESVSDHGITVVIDTNLTPELLEEGMVREIVSKIQTMRKDSGFEVMDHIHVGVSGNDVVASVMQKNAEEICADTLCDEILYDTVTDNEKSWNINGEKVTLSVKKL